MQPYISLIIPTFNEKANIKTAIASAKKALHGYNYEIIVVDGHSKDGTANIAKENGAKVAYDDVGKGSALLKGFKEAKGKIIISMDADLSNKASELRLLITGIEIGYDICMGSRFITGGGSEDMPLIRKFGNGVFVLLVNVLFHSNYTDLCYGYRSFRKSALAKLHLKEKGFGIETEMSIQAKKRNLRILEVPSFEKKRANGEGKLHSLRDGTAILRTIIKNI